MKERGGGDIVSIGRGRERGHLWRLHRGEGRLNPKLINQRWKVLI